MEAIARRLRDKLAKVCAAVGCDIAHLEGRIDAVTSNGPSNEIFSWHPGGANICMTDGSVRFVKESVSPLVIRALVTRAGSEVISADY